MINLIKKIFSIIKERGLGYFFSHFILSTRAINFWRFSKSKYNKNYTVNYQPIGITICVNNKCNMKCTFCYRNENNIQSKIVNYHTPGNITIYEFKKIIKKLNSVLDINFSGFGEPLLNPEVIDMIWLSKKKHKKVGLTTNGVNLDKKNIKRLINCKTDTITISLKGVDSEEFSLITGLDDSYFNLIINNIKNLVDYKKEKKSNTKIIIFYVCSKNKIENMKKMIKLADNLGIDRLGFIVLFPDNFRSSEKMDEVTFYNEKEINELKKIPKRKSLTINWPSIMNDQYVKKNCFTVDGITVLVDRLGNVSYCCKIPPQARYGNIYKDKNILNTQVFTSIRRAIYKNPPYVCKYCSILNKSVPES